MFAQWERWKHVPVLLFLLLVISLFMRTTATAVQSNTEDVKIPAPSSTAQKLYASVQDDLLQLRILIKNGRAQSSVGSGFLVGNSNLVVTNYHVISRIALEPETYEGEYVDTHKKRGAMQLLAVDVLHDLAIVSIDRKGTGFFKISGQLPALKHGQHLYALGNPLDLGFAISEGAYNGIIRRGVYEQLMFTGPINAGMSGGPCITVDGRLAGVNVSKRRDGELVSFLVPFAHVQTLLKQAVSLQSIPKKFDEIVGRQLLAHQSVMVNQLLAEPLAIKTLGKYSVPVRESDQMRCWGESYDKPDRTYTGEQIRCSMESALYVSDKLKTGQVSLHHQLTVSRDLGALRFAKLTSRIFKKEGLGSNKNRHITGPSCTEEFLAIRELSLRAVLCVRAYRKFAGLYDFTVLASTTDETLMNLESRMDIKGVSYENGMRISGLFLESFGAEKKP